MDKEKKKASVHPAATDQKAHVENIKKQVEKSRKTPIYTGPGSDYAVKKAKAKHLAEIYPKYY